MKGDNQGRAVRWIPDAEGVVVRVFVDTEVGIPVTTCELRVTLESLEDWYQCAVNERERWAQRTLF